MRSLALVAVFAAAAALAQAPADSSIPSDPQSLLAAAAPFYNFRDANLKSFHLKGTYQLYDLKGAPAEGGTWEYLQAAPGVFRSSLIRGGLARTLWVNAAGERFVKEGGGAPYRYFERIMPGLVLSPMPALDLLDDGRNKLDLKIVPAGSLKLACVSALRKTQPNGKPVTKAGDPEQYCFETSTKALRLTYSRFLTTEYDHVVRTQGRYFPRNVQVTAGKHNVFSLSLDTIESVQVDEAALKPPSDAVLESTSDTAVRRSDDIIEGSILKKIAPVYPMAAKAAREQGTVIIGAVIGTDGKIHDLDVLAAPSPLLADSARNAVKQWEYKPCLLHGNPVEVETTIHVIYSMMPWHKGQPDGWPSARIRKIRISGAQRPHGVIRRSARLPGLPHRLPRPAWPRGSRG